MRKAFNNFCVSATCVCTRLTTCRLPALEHSKQAFDFSALKSVEVVLIHFMDKETEVWKA